MKSNMLFMLCDHDFGRSVFKHYLNYANPMLHLYFDGAYLIDAEQDIIDDLKDYIKTIDLKNVNIEKYTGQALECLVVPDPFTCLKDSRDLFCEINDKSVTHKLKTIYVASRFLDYALDILKPTNPQVNIFGAGAETLFSKLKAQTYFQAINLCGTFMFPVPIAHAPNKDVYDDMLLSLRSSKIGFETLAYDLARLIAGKDCLYYDIKDGLVNKKKFNTTKVLPVTEWESEAYILSLEETEIAVKAADSSIEKPKSSGLCKNI